MILAYDFFQEPFSAPPAFDECLIDQLLEIVSEKHAEATDDLWLLQTDPGYFHDFANYWREYKVDNLSGANTTKDTKLRYLESRVFLEPVHKIHHWTLLDEHLRCVKSEFITYRKAIGPGQQLPETYKRSLEYLKLLVIGLLVKKLTELKELLFVSPAWRSIWKVDTELGDSQVVYSLKSGLRIDLLEMYKRDRIFCCLFVMTDKPKEIL